MEDGGEKNVTFYGNLGLGQRRFVGSTILGTTGAIPADKLVDFEKNLFVLYNLLDVNIHVLF